MSTVYQPVQLSRMFIYVLNTSLLTYFQTPTSTRQFHVASVLNARKTTSKQLPTTKAQRAALAQKKRNWYDSEKLTLAEAINVLRVSKPDIL